MPAQPPAAPTLEGATWIRHLGSGGFADVHLYQQSVPDRQVAVKVLRSRENRQLDAAFRAEVNLLARISAHPAIVSVFGAGLSEDGRQYIIMEYCPPPNLAQRARQRRYSVLETIDVGIRLAGAVGSLHAEGILHRDIKPANVLVTEFGYPVLVDFGLAGKLVNSRLSAGQGFSVPWAPPEQHSAHAMLDTSVDVYSLAATMYTMLAGRAPFTIPGGDNSDVAMMARVKNQAVPATGRPDMPSQLQSILEIAMSKDPANRYSSAVEFAKMLQQVQVGMNQKMTPIDLLNDSVIPERTDDGFPETRAAVVVLNPPTKPTVVREPLVLGEVGSLPRRALIEDPVPDAESEPELPAVDSHQRRVLIGGIALVALVCIAVVVFGVRAVLSQLENRAQEASPAVPAPPPAEIVPGSAVAVSDLQGEVVGDQVRFTWNHDDADASFLYRVLDPLRSHQASETRQREVMVDPEPGQTCLEVVVTWSDGRSSEPTNACVDTP